MKVVMAKDLLKANSDLAKRNREMFQKARVLVVNMISSPGAGKTTLLEKTIPLLKNELSLAVIEGDVYTTRDAQRIENQGVEVIQINTSGGCHLDANMIASATKDLPLDELDLLFIENVGNLVCPAGFDLGEDHKVAVLSIAEGDDKPAKYPAVFRDAEAVVLNKIDLLPYTDFNLEEVTKQIRDINGGNNMFKVSAKTGEGLEAWLAWLRLEANNKRALQRG